MIETGTRLIKYFKGIVLYMPIFTMLFFVFSLANMATPLTLNFVAGTNESIRNLIN